MNSPTGRLRIIRKIVSPASPRAGLNPVPANTPTFQSGRNAIFLSYAHEDAAAACRIAEVLQAAGVEVWFDQSALRGGDSWDAKIRRQIRECALFMPIISANTNARAEGYFRLEWRLAIDRSLQRADDATFFVPVVIDDTADASARVPDRFREVQWTRLPAGEVTPELPSLIRGLLEGSASPAATPFAPEPAPSAAATPTSATKPPTAITPQSAGTGKTRVVTGAPESEWRPLAGQPVPSTEWILEQKLGEGGFGEVWLGRHQRMKDRRVFKFCFDPERVRSLKREMTLFRVLKERIGDHPNIVRLIDVHLGEAPFYVEMEYIEGQNLKTWCEQQGGIAQVSLATRLQLVAQIADALHVAHKIGVIHRDVKPGNILIAQLAVPGATPTAKLSDFGIGQVLSEEALQGMTSTGFTQSVVVGASGVNSGTQLYMAPELFAGTAATAGSDIYSLGVVLFQLVTGDFHRPVTTDWARAIEDPLLHEDLARCFAGRAEERFEDAEQLAASLRALEQRRREWTQQQALAAAREQASRRWKRLRFGGIAAILIALVATLAWVFQRNAKIRWARQTALPEIERLIKAEEIDAALKLARAAGQYIADDPALTRLLPRLTLATSFVSTPAEADVYVKPYLMPGAAWAHAGKTPLRDLPLARDYYRVLVRKEGFAPIERWLPDRIGTRTSTSYEFTLDAVDAIPTGMVRVEAGSRGSVRVESFFIDRFEVTNREFKAFIERGGYTNPAYWKQPFVRDGQELAAAEALALFHDATGRPGPATWENGTYPIGRDNHPVTGVSWFEAAAYAESVGKRLPTMHHWKRATGLGPGASGPAGVVASLSNFQNKGMAAVGEYQGLSAYGAYDLAGNAKEWCWNEATPGKRYILGGGADEPAYMFYLHQDAFSPFDRSPANGFRCMRAIPGVEAEPGLDNPVPPPEVRDYSHAQPVNDETYRIYRSFFAYDKTDLEAKLEGVDESQPLWRREKISLKAAYGSERMNVYLFVPRNVTAPYQAVVFFPGSGALTQTSSDGRGRGTFDNFGPSVIKSGRVFVYPIYNGTHERGSGRSSSDIIRAKNDYRDYLIQWSKDLGRTIDYLETRQDIRADKLAYLGFSLGAGVGPVLTAIETRFRASILASGGIFNASVVPEADQINHGPRVTVPTLMVNGRFDFLFPEPGQRQLYELVGVPAADKEYVLLETGHNVRRDLIETHVLRWLDRFLGPVK